MTGCNTNTHTHSHSSQRASQKAHGSMKINRLFHLFQCHRLTLRAASFPYLLLMKLRGGRLLKGLVFASKAFRFASWSKRTNTFATPVKCDQTQPLTCFWLGASTRTATTGMKMPESSRCWKISYFVWNIWAGSAALCCSHLGLDATFRTNAPQQYDKESYSKKRQDINITTHRGLKNLWSDSATTRHLSVKGAGDSGTFRVFSRMELLEETRDWWKASVYISHLNATVRKHPAEPQQETPGRPVLTFSVCHIQQRDTWERLSQSKPQRCTTFFAVSCFSHLPPPLYLSQSTSLRATSVKASAVSQAEALQQ